MIVKPIPSDNIPTGIRYANDIKKGAEIILSNGVRIDSNKNCINDFLLVAKQREVSKPFLHTVFSFSPEDSSKVSENMMADIVLEYLQRMGLAQNQYIVYVHKDKLHPHCHCFSSRVGFNGDLASDSFTKVKAFKFARETEIKYTLTVAKGRGNSLERSDENKAKRTVKNEIRQKVFQGLDSGIADFDKLSKYLELQGIEMKVQYQSTGRVNGISFRKDNIAIKGSSLDRALSFQRLEKRFSHSKSRAFNKQARNLTGLVGKATALANDFARINSEYPGDDFIDIKI